MRDSGSPTCTHKSRLRPGKPVRNRRRLHFISLLFTTLFAMAVPAAATETDAGFGTQLVRLINDYRTGQGLGALTLADELAALAHEHSQAMAAQQRLSHDGFQSRFGRAGSPACVENVAWNHPTAQAVFEGWRQSPSHHVNLINPKLKRVGLASHARYVTFFACR